MILVVRLPSCVWSRARGVLVLIVLQLVRPLCTSATQTHCRDRLKQPFSPDSIWNTPIGSGAVFLPAELYVEPPSPAPGDVCEAGKQLPSKRTGCSAWRAGWNETLCLAAGCCYDPHPNPDPAHYAWCYENATSGGGGPDRCASGWARSCVRTCPYATHPQLDQSTSTSTTSSCPLPRTQRPLLSTKVGGGAIQSAAVTIAAARARLSRWEQCPFP